MDYFSSMVTSTLRHILIATWRSITLLITLCLQFIQPMLVSIFQFQRHFSKMCSIQKTLQDFKGWHSHSTKSRLYREYKKFPIWSCKQLIWIHEQALSSWQACHWTSKWSPFDNFPYRLLGFLSICFWGFAIWLHINHTFRHKLDLKNTILIIEDHRYIFASQWVCLEIA